MWLKSKWGKRVTPAGLRAGSATFDYLVHDDLNRGDRAPIPSELAIGGSQLEEQLRAGAYVYAYGAPKRAEEELGGVRTLHRVVCIRIADSTQCTGGTIRLPGNRIPSWFAEAVLAHPL